MKREIFKAYDVRGLYPEELDARAALAIGQAVADFLGGPSAVVGTDMRQSGVELRDALVEGLRAAGVEVIDVGRVATPMVYFATAALRAAGGVMITASHNPAAYNGMKLCGRDAVPIGIETGLARIRDRALEIAGARGGEGTHPAQRAEGERRNELPAGAPRAGLVRRDVREAYYQSLLDTFPRRPALRVAIDAGNGIAGEAVSGLLERLPLDVTRLYFEPDGSFPNHEADPLKAENLVDLQREVRARGADLGIAFDGDGDRAVFVDERGEAVPADLMTALMADVVLEHGLLGAGPGAHVVHDLRSSRAVPEAIRARGAVPVRSRVGHAFMKARMRECGGCFGGELSGHYYFRFPQGYVADDGAAAMMLLLQVLDLRRRPLSELWRPFRRYAQSGEINSRVADVSAALARVRAAFADGRADELDGLTVDYPDWWFNLRPSNTEPLLRLNVEAPNETALKARCEEVLALVRS
jgi:phosphomannomutase